jgi:hypothetical protein
MDAYSAALDKMEQARALQWEYLEEEREHPPEDDLDKPLTDNQRQWIYDDVAIA